MIETPTVDWLALSPTLALLAASGIALLSAVLVPEWMRRGVAAGVAVIGFAVSTVFACIVFSETQVAEPLGAGLRRQHALRLFKEIPAGMVEIVGMLVVAQQHRIDRADIAHAERGTRQLLQFHMRQLILAGRIEGRIGEQAEPVDLDQGGGASDQRDGDAHVILLLAAAAAGRVTR